MPLAASIAIAFSAALTPSVAASTENAPQPVQIQAAQTIQQQVETYFRDYPVMIKVAKCESHFRQYNKKDGSVHRGKVNDKDVGVMQINEYYHLKASEKLNIDIYSVEGNLEYARYLFEREGTTPWLSSSPCWGKENHIVRR